MYFCIVITNALIKHWPIIDNRRPTIGWLQINTKNLFCSLI